jgi:hypothetical protein
MKKLTTIVCTIMIFVGVMGIALSVDAVSYVWVNDAGSRDYVEEGAITFDADPWETGVTITDPLAVTHFKWLVDGYDYASVLGGAPGEYQWIDLSLGYDDMESDGRGYIYYEQKIEPILTEDLWWVIIHADSNIWTVFNNDTGYEYFGEGRWERVDEQIIPEPTVLLLLGTGLIGLIAIQRKVSQK